MSENSSDQNSNIKTVEKIIGMQPQHARIYLARMQEIHGNNSALLDFYKRKFDRSKKREAADLEEMRQSVIFLETENEIWRGRIKEMENLAFLQSGALAVN